ncbi:hypothetical protein [Spiroplasma endosymbiont of Dactylopius coccus]
MAIKDPLMFITIEEFKNWKGFNKLEFDDTTTPDNEIWFAISVASNNIDYLSGHSISKKWPETTLTEFTDEIQTATAYYVRFLLTKDSNYIRGQSSISQGGMTYSENNPNEPYYIVSEVFNCLRKIKEYPNITGFNLDVLPKRYDFFSNFFSNFAEDSPLTRYLELINLKTNDTRVKIYLKHPKHLIGTELWIDTTGIKSFDNLTTIELFTKYFSNDTMKLVDGKEGQEKKVISATSGNSLWEVDKDNTNFIKSKDDKGISANDKRIIDVGTPTFLTDATNKEYVDKKQDKLIAGENIKIDKETNTISATGGSGESLWLIDPNSPNIIQPKEKRIITSNNTRIVYIADPTQPQDAVNLRTLNKNIPDLTDYYKKEEVDKELEDKIDKKQFQYAFVLNTFGTEIPNLETKDKTIVGAINELKEKIKDKKFSNDYFKYNTETNEILLNDEENSLLCRDLLENNEYKLLKTQNKKLLQAINEILEKQPQPSPSGSNWKEVGTREKNKWDNWQITYDFQENKHYRVYYSWSIYNPVYTIQEFIITDKKIAGVQIQIFNDSANIVILSVQHAKLITIYTVKGNLKGNVWKLEELQE